MKSILSAALALVASASFASALFARALFARASDSRTKLNGPLVSTTIVGDVHSMALSPDGQWVAYLADQDTAGKRELYAVRRDGTGSASKLNGPLVTGGAIHRFFFTPDGARVLYHADQDVNDVDELYSAPVDGSAPALKLNGPLVAGGDVYWTGIPWPVTSDGQTIVYTADEDADGVYQIYSVPTDGSALPTPLVPGDAYVLLTRLASDDVTVVFTADLVTNDEFELFRVPIDASAAPVRLNGTITPGTDVIGFDIAPDASRVLYRGDRSLTGKIELFSVPLDLSSAAVVLNGPIPPQGDVFNFQITSTSQRVVYQADQDSDEDNEIYSAPIDGSASAVRLNDAITVGSISYTLSADGSRVVYSHSSGSAVTLYTVPIDRSSSPVVINPTSGWPSSWRITPDSTRVLVVEDELYSVPIDGSGAATQLCPPAVDVGTEVRGFVIAGDSEHALYAMGRYSGSFRELFSVPVDGSAPPVLLSLGAPSWSRLEGDFILDAVSDTAIYRGDTDMLGVVEVFSVPLGASAPPLVLNDPLPTGTVLGEVTSFGVSPDGNWAVYADAQGFHGVPIGRREPARLLTPPGLSSGNGVGVAFHSEVGFTPDSKRVFLSVTTDTELMLYRAPVDGSEPASLIHTGGSGSVGPADRFHTFRFTPDGATVVYSLFVFNYFGPPNFGVLYSAPVDGSVPPTLLSNGNSLIGSVLSSAGTHAVVGHAGSDFEGPRLRSVPVDGSTGPTSLLPGSLAFHSGLQLAADGTTVVYIAYDAFGSGEAFLYSSPADASSAPTLLASAGLSGGIALNRVNPATPHVFHLKSTASARELYHGPVDGSSAAILLATLPSSVTVQDLVFSPDGARIVYRADANVATQFELYVVPTDGSHAPVKVNGPIVSGGDVTAGLPGEKPHFAFTPDGSRVVYRADARVNNINELWSAPAAGGGPATPLNNPLASSALAIYPDFHLLANSRDILFRGNPAIGRLPLWEARIDQTGPFKLRCRTFAHSGLVEAGYQVTAGERYVVYRSDHDTQGVTELHAFPLRHVLYRTDPTR